MTASVVSAAVAAPEDVAAFWRDAGPERWFEKDENFDATVKQRFLATYEAAAAGRLAHWEETAEHAFALLIVLDQFPRNMFRGDRRTYAADPLAKAIAERALARGFDRELPVPERIFFYLPFMHSEAVEDQARCVALFQALGDAELQRHADVHYDIIRRFGRFPHRNPLLGRQMTDEERAFLESGGFAG